MRSHVGRTQRAIDAHGQRIRVGDRTPESVHGLTRESASTRAISASGSSSYTVEINDRKYEVAFDGGEAKVNGRSYTYSISEGAGAGASIQSAATGSGEIVCAELAGQVLRIIAGEGDRVAEGDVLLVMEALKMEIEIKSPCAGVVDAILVSGDQSVNTGDALVEIAS